jgi:hypothetical protein
LVHIHTTTLPVCNQQSGQAYNIRIMFNETFILWRLLITQYHIYLARSSNLCFLCNLIIRISYHVSQLYLLKISAGSYQNWHTYDTIYICTFICYDLLSVYSFYIVLKILQKFSNQVYIVFYHIYCTFFTSAVHSTLIDACRTIMVWAVGMTIYYGFDKVNAYKFYKYSPDSILNNTRYYF